LRTVVAPPLSPITRDSVLLPVFDPASVSVRAPDWLLNPIAPVAEKLTVPVPTPEPSIVPPAVSTLNSRVELCSTLPVYRSVPPARTKSADEPPTEPRPMELSVFTFARRATETAPELMSVTPVYEFVLGKVERIGPLLGQAAGPRDDTRDE
jgi:hypothetical protein